MLESILVSGDLFELEERLAEALNDAKIDLKNVRTESGAHPEGRKRGGIVPVLSFPVHSLEAIAEKLRDSTFRDSVVPIIERLGSVSSLCRIFWDEGNWAWVAYDSDY